LNTDADQTPASLAARNLVDGYETLRSRAMQGDLVSAGMALFLSRGMAVWMQVWKEYEPSIPRVISSNKNTVRVALPADMQQDLVMALVGLTLHARKELR